MSITNLRNKITKIPFKTKAVALASLLTIIPVLGTGAFAAWLSANNVYEQARAEQKLLSRSMSQNIGRFLGLRSTDMKTIALVPTFSDPKIPVADREIVLNRFLDKYAFYDSLTILDLRGNPIVLSKGSKRINYGDREYFKETIATGKSQISDVEIDKSSVRSGIYITAPIIDPKTGKMTAVVQGRMSVTALAIIGKTYDEANRRWLISDLKSKTILLAVDHMQSGSSTKDIQSLDRFSIADKSVTTEDINTFSNHPKLFTHNSVAAHASEQKNSQLVATIAQNLTSIRAAESQILIAIGLGTLAAGGFTTAIGVLLSDRITKYIQKVVSTILSSSEEIVDTVQQQEVNINEQANSAISTTSTINQLGSFSFQAAEQADASAMGARQALALAEEGTRAVQGTLAGMTDLREKVDAIAVQIANLSEQTGQISNISGIVSELAYQTNMLALKAAVEAARAGEEGKGFGVVAGEIRKLADRSKKSAEKIDTLAHDIQSEINRTVMVTEEGTKTVQTGIELAQATSSTFVGVTNAVNNLFLNSQQISNSTKQQAVAIQQVLSAMNAIAQGSQESAVGMFRVKSSTQELNQIADELLQAVLN
jgi:methyl-accepting chemotaxis protein